MTALNLHHPHHTPRNDNGVGPHPTTPDGRTP